MNWLERVLQFIFPYRAHLEREVEYLRTQVAQQRRRLDELEGAMLEMMREMTKKEPRREPGKPVVVKPRGWEAYKAQARAHGQSESEPDAGSEVSPANVGA